jgi:hypothetical protein
VKPYKSKGFIFPSTIVFSELCSPDNHPLTIGDKLSLYIDLLICWYDGGSFPPELLKVLPQFSRGNHFFEPHDGDLGDLGECGAIKFLKFLNI